MSEIMKAFTDGSSRGNPGPGGWGSIIQIDGKIIEVGGNDANTTNNRMELTAVLETLELISDHVDGRRPLKIFTDSSYVANGITSWINGWKRNNWKTQAGEEVANVDLWQRIANLVEAYELEMVNIAGHAGIPGNERADEIATAFADNSMIDLYQGSKDNYRVNLNNLSTDLSKLKAKKRSGGKAFSYLSLVDGELMIHKTWDECKSRVDGMKGVKFKKALSKVEEEEIRKSWGV